MSLQIFKTGNKGQEVLFYVAGITASQLHGFLETLSNNKSPLGYVVVNSFVLIKKGCCALI